MKHIELEDKLVNKIFKKFINKVSPYGIKYLGINHINRIPHKRYDFKFKYNDNYYYSDENDSLDLFAYLFVKHILVAFPMKPLYTLSYHTESFEVRYYPDLCIEYPPYPNSDDVLYYIDDNNLIWVPWFGHSIYVMGDNLINVIDNFCEKHLEQSKIINIKEHMNGKYFKDKNTEEKGPVVDLILKANDAIIDHVEIFEENFALIDSLIVNNHNKYAIYGETKLNEKQISNILRNIRDKDFDIENGEIVKEFEVLLKTYNMTSLIIKGV
ncbi:hypothetical protein [Macrococcus equi]|uniref:hypothetical protein n=1 Tax=Macrococcus equi TaxID=3395462 RepID=UPI0039BE41D7